MARELAMARARTGIRATVVTVVACLGILSGYLPAIEPAAAAQGELVRVSVAPNGSQGNGASAGGVLSGDGRYVVFTSDATNLVAGDTNGREDIFRFDRSTGAVRPVSVTATGAFQSANHASPVVSGDGRFIAFWSEGVFDATDGPKTPDVFVKDMDSGSIERVTLAPDGSNNTTVDRFSQNSVLAMSEDARWVVFESESTNLVAGDADDGVADIYLRDRLTATTTLVSKEVNGLPGSSIGLDAVMAGAGELAVVAFRVEAVDRTQRLVIRHLLTGVEHLVNTGDTKRLPFLAVAAGGATAVISGGANGVANLYDVAAGTLTPLLDTVDWSSTSSENFSHDLRFFAAAVLNGSTFRRVDRETDEVTEMPRGIDNAGPNMPALPTSISNDGTAVAFASAASNLVFGDTNAVGDSFVVRVAKGTFADDDGSPFEADIEWLAAEGITQGCALELFCPKAAVTRGQMASFLVRSLDLPVVNDDFFGDDNSSPHQADINALAVAGITEGCGPAAFCPNDPVTRQQMASFLTRALELPISTTDFFTDDNGSLHEDDINAMASARITLGCSPSLFCPAAGVLREQMAAFLHRGFVP